MKTTYLKASKKFTLVGLLCLSIPLIILGLWIYAFNSGDSQPNRVEIFNHFFPDFLQGRYSVAYLSLAFSILSVCISFINISIKEMAWKALNILILVIGLFMVLLNLFQMM